MYRIIVLLLLLLATPYIAVISDVGISHAYADGEADSDGEADGSGGDNGGSDSDSGGAGGESESGSGESGGSDAGHGDGNNKQSINRSYKSKKGKYGRSHQKSIRKAVQRNQILPLSKIKRRIAKYTSSEIISIELEHKRFGWVYEFKIIDRKGRLLDVYMNATTGKVIRSKNQGKWDD